MPTQINNFTVSLYAKTKNGKPCIEIRTLTSDPEAIKVIISSAINETPINVFPVFRNRIRAYDRLIQNGILKYDKDKEHYYFVI